MLFKTVLKNESFHLLGCKFIKASFVSCEKKTSDCSNIVSEGELQSQYFKKKEDEGNRIHPSISKMFLDLREEPH